MACYQLNEFKNDFVGSLLRKLFNFYKPASLFFQFNKDREQRSNDTLERGVFVQSGEKRAHFDVSYKEGTIELSLIYLHSLLKVRHVKTCLRLIHPILKASSYWDYNGWSKVWVFVMLTVLTFTSKG